MSNKRSGGELGAANVKRIGMTASDWIRKQLKRDEDVQPAVLLAKAEKIGLKFNASLISDVRKRAGLKPRRRGAKNGRDAVATINAALTNGHKAGAKTDKAIKWLVKRACRELAGTNVHRLTIDIRSRKFKTAIEHEEEGEI